MQIYNADLHIHSPYSIAVSQNMNLESIYDTAMKKGLNILSTGDITQPDWRKYLKDNLEFNDGMYFYKDLSFIIGTELEDNESIHHVILLPDFSAAEKLQEMLDPYVKNITGRWAGRPHVNKSPADIVEFIDVVGGICGPAHAFTPFKSIFRQGRHKTLAEAYGGAEKKIAFLELGLSADTNLADRMESLKDITFLSNSDAHSEGVQSLGREFNRMELEKPSFDEIKKACFRRKNRRVSLNVGLEPRLGKYFIMFCRKCRRRIINTIQNNINNNKSQDAPLLQSGWTPSKIDANFIHYKFKNIKHQNDFLKLCSNGVIKCKACESDIKEKNKIDKKSKKVAIPKLKLGVSERVNEIATWTEPQHPDHRPPYLDIIPLVEIVRKICNVKNPRAKSVIKMYEDLIKLYGTEYDILIDLPIDKIKNDEVAQIISAFRDSKIKFIPGGGGTFGEISLDEL